MLRIKYIPVFVRNIEEGLRFFKEKLGFDVKDTIVLNETDHIPMQIDGLYLTMALDKENRGYKTQIILNTDDCLKDYHNLKTAGIDFIDQPQYLAIGLAAEFNDDYGNQYILLEERNYNEI